MAGVEDCFGKLWDISTKPCSVCSDNEICGIITGQATRNKVKEIEKAKKFLDLSEMDCIDEEAVKMFVTLKQRTVKQLVDKVAELGKTEDDVAVIEWVKRFIKTNPKIYTKDGIVHIRK